MAPAQPTIDRNMFGVFEATWLCSPCWVPSCFPPGAQGRICTCAGKVHDCLLFLLFLHEQDFQVLNLTCPGRQVNCSTYPGCGVRELRGRWPSTGKMARKSVPSLLSASLPPPTALLPGGPPALPCHRHPHYPVWLALYFLPCLPCLWVRPRAAKQALPKTPSFVKSVEVRRGGEIEGELAGERTIPLRHLRGHALSVQEADHFIQQTEVLARVWAVLRRAAVAIFSPGCPPHSAWENQPANPMGQNFP